MLFWVQIHGLPREDVNPENAFILLKKVGRVVEIDDPFKLGGGAPTHFIRARVAINIKKTIWSGCWIQKDDERRVWVHFKYERLQGLCFKCGEFGHEIKHCIKPLAMAAINKNMPKYGQFLTAFIPRAFQKQGEGSSSNQRQGFCHDQNNFSNGDGLNNENTDAENRERQENPNLYSDANIDENSIPLAKMIFHKFDCREYDLPSFQGDLPYYVELPPEDFERNYHTTSSIPARVEESLSNKLAIGLNLKRGRGIQK